MNTKTTAQRQKEFRQRRQHEGWRRLTVWLDPSDCQALEDCVELIATPNGKQSASREQIIRAAIVTYRNALLANRN